MEDLAKLIAVFVGTLIVTLIGGFWASIRSNRKLGDKIAEPAAKVSENTDALNRLATTVDTLAQSGNVTVTSLSGVVAQQRAEVETLKSQVAALVADGVARNQRVSTYITTMEGLVDEKTARVEEIKGLRDRIVTLESSVLRIGSERDTAVEGKKTADGQVVALQAEVSEVRGQLANDKTELKELRDRITTLEGKMAQITEERDGLKQQIENITTEYTAYKTTAEMTIRDLTESRDTLALRFNALLTDPPKVDKAKAPRRKPREKVPA